MDKKSYTCMACGKAFSKGEVIPSEPVREMIEKQIARDYPNGSSESFIGKFDLRKYRTKYIHSLLGSEKGEFTALEQEISRSLKGHEITGKEHPSGV